MPRLLTETADYDTPGSWGHASDGWPGFRGDEAYNMFVFANCVQSIPYGSYVLMSERGYYGSTQSYLRVHAEYKKQLSQDFQEAGRPAAEVSIARRERFGKLRSDGLREKAPKWKEQTKGTK